MLDDEQLAAIIEVGYEQRGIEFKAAGDRTDRAFLATVARAVLALSNQRDGGHIIIGLSEDGIEADGTGLSDEQLGRWLSFDDVTDQINAYADPPVRIQLGRGRLPNDRAVAIIEVAEFSEIPTLSKKGLPAENRRKAALHAFAGEAGELHLHDPKRAAGSDRAGDRKAACALPRDGAACRCQASEGGGHSGPR